MKAFRIYVRVDNFVSKKFHKFANVFSSRKFILNFQINILKGMKALYLSVKFLAFKGPVNKNFNVEKISYVEKFIMFFQKKRKFILQSFNNLS